MTATAATGLVDARVTAKAVREPRRKLAHGCAPQGISSDQRDLLYPWVDPRHDRSRLVRRRVKLHRAVVRRGAGPKPREETTMEELFIDNDPGVHDDDLSNTPLGNDSDD